MSRLSDIMSSMREKEKAYLRSGKVAIAKNNLRAMTVMSFLSAFVIAASRIFWLVASKAEWSIFVIPMDRPVPSSLWITVPVLLVFFAASILITVKNWQNIPLISTLCAVYVVVQFICFYAVDVFTSPYALSFFMPMVFIATAGTFIFSTKMFNTINLITLAVYIFSDLMFKTDAPYVCAVDTFIVLAAFGMAACLATNNRQCRVGDFETNSRYKSLSMRDPLLENIYNKRGYEEAIKQYLLSKNPKVTCAFIILDLNDFKGINDNYGHDMGDNILRCMSGTLVSLFRDSDIIGRFGGDEFIVLADGLDDEDAVEKKLRYISELIGQRAQEAGAIKVYSSLGAIICSGQKVDFDHLFKLADESMYEAKEKVKKAVKESGRNIDCFIIKHYTEPDDE